MDHRKGDRRAARRAEAKDRAKRVSCEWCGGGLIGDELHEAGGWWSEPRCLQCGRVPSKHQAVPPGLLERARLLRTQPQQPPFPRNLRGWRSLMERPSRGERDKPAGSPPGRPAGPAPE